MKKKRSQRIPGWLLVLGIGATFIVLGILQGDFQETLAKAARVCYECIGIG
ncbi:MAG: CD1871A family CXXC motif-containing protein [Raoultibacter sp.]